MPELVQTLECGKGQSLPALGIGAAVHRSHFMDDADDLPLSLFRPSGLPGQTRRAEQAEWQIVGIVHEVTAVDGSANPQGRQGLAFTTLQSLNQLRHLAPD